MFIRRVNDISTRFENINLNITNMQPKAERPPVCPKGQVPELHLTPSCGIQKKITVHHHSSDSPWLLKPKHEMPATPPPQTNPRPFEFFPQRIGVIPSRTQTE